MVVVVVRRWWANNLGKRSREGVRPPLQFPPVAEILSHLPSCLDPEGCTLS